MNILVLDVGTSGLKAIVFDDHGNILKKIFRKYSPQYSGDQVEMDVTVVDDSLWDALAEMRNWCQQSSVDFGSVSVTAQRSSVIPVDRDGTPLRNALMWMDKRATAICEEYKDREKEIYQICGMQPTPVFSAPKILWLKRNEPDIYNKSYKLIGFHEYILHTITGKFVTDTTIAGRSCLFDVQKLSWSPKLIEMFEVDIDKLCTIIPVGSICGTTNIKFSKLFGLKMDLPVVTAGGDQQCAAVGLGCISPGNTEINSGTGAYVLSVADKPLVDKTMRTVCNPSAVAGRWIIEGSVLSCGSAIDWMNDEFFHQKGDAYEYENFDKAALSSPIGANGLIIVPNFSGSGTPFCDPTGKARIFNLSFRNKKSDYARALIEGIAMEIADCAAAVANVFDFDCMEKISCGGGLSKNNLYNEILANIFGRTILIPDNKEATALGAWVSAAVANGLFPRYEDAYRESITNKPLNTITVDAEKVAFYTEVKKIRKEFLRNYK